MKQPQQKEPAAGKNVKSNKNSLQSFEDELGDDFLGSWKPSRMNKSVANLDFVDGLPVVKEKKFRLPDKFDLDVDFNAGLTSKLSSFDIDFDFLKSPKRGEEVKESKDDIEDSQRTRLLTSKKRGRRNKSCDDTSWFISQDRDSAYKSRDFDDTSSFKSQDQVAGSKVVESDYTFSWKSQEEPTRSKNVDLNDLTVTTKNLIREHADEATSTEQPIKGADEEANTSTKPQNPGVTIDPFQNRNLSPSPGREQANINHIRSPGHVQLETRLVAEESIALDDDKEILEEQKESETAQTCSVQSPLNEVQQSSHCLVSAAPGTRTENEKVIPELTKVQLSEENSLLHIQRGASRVPIQDHVRHTPQEDCGIPAQPRVLPEQPTIGTLQTSQDEARVPKRKPKSPGAPRRTKGGNSTPPMKSLRSLRSNNIIRALSFEEDSRPLLSKKKHDVAPLYANNSLTAAKHFAPITIQALSTSFQSLKPTQVSALKTLRSQPLRPSKTEKKIGDPSLKLTENKMQALHAPAPAKTVNPLQTLGSQSLPATHINDKCEPLLIELPINTQASTDVSIGLVRVDPLEESPNLQPECKNTNKSTQSRHQTACLETKTTVLMPSSVKLKASMPPSNTEKKIEAPSLKLTENRVQAVHAPTRAETEDPLEKIPNLQLACTNKKMSHQLGPQTACLETKTTMLVPSIAKLTASASTATTKNKILPSQVSSLSVIGSRAENSGHSRGQRIKLPRPEDIFVNAKPISVRHELSQAVQEARDATARSIKEPSSLLPSNQDKNINQNDHQSLSPRLLLEDTPATYADELIREHTDISRKAEYYSLELDKMHDSLKQKHDNAKDLLVQTIRHNVEMRWILSPTKLDEINRLQNSIKEQLQEIKQLVAKRRTKQD